MEKAGIPLTTVGFSVREALPDGVKAAIDDRFLWFEGWKGNLKIFALEDDKFLTTTGTVSAGQAVIWWAVIDEESAIRHRRADGRDEKMDDKYREDNFDDDYMESDDESEDY